ncbi:MAG: AGE family epimerase/isomerase [candidate division WOR-3 bacterium]
MEPSTSFDTYYKEIEGELRTNILPFWDKTIDLENGGFFGRILNNGEVKKKSPKASVLNTRILWTYSAVYRKFREKRYMELAQRAYSYLKDFFYDKEKGGIFWLLDCKGNPIDTKKQIYAQAFCLYALSEFYKIYREKEVLDWTSEIFELIEKYSFDPEYLGYFEAMDRNWNWIEDVRLSEKDQNERKTTNTHLHLLEAYTNFLEVKKDERVKTRLKQLVQIFLDKIIDPATGHFNLFFDEKWNKKSQVFSYGHDIEGSWLIWKASSLLGDESLKRKVKEASLRLAEATLRDGVDSSGGVMNEGNIMGVFDSDKHWWVQAEAMVGFFNAFELSGDDKFFNASWDSWNFIKKYIIDYKNGEWFFRVNREGIPYYEEDKVGPWKCPYHNSRACLELMERLGPFRNN